MEASKTTIFNAIMRGAWLIEPMAAVAYWSEIKRFVAGEPENAFFSSKQSSEIKGVSTGSVAVIPIKGALMKHDYCGELGTASIGAMIEEADRSYDVSGIVLVHDSPGGTVDGTETLGDIVKATTKPIVSFVDGLSASASYWIASQSDHIFMSGNTSEVGSIGVIACFQNMWPIYKQAGAEKHEIVSDLSPDKNKVFFDALEGDYEGIKESFLNPVAKLFHDAVTTSRPYLNPTCLTGKMYLTQEAISLGMVDGVGTLADAIKKAKELAGLSDGSKKNLIKTNKMFNTKSELEKVIETLAVKIKAEGINALCQKDVEPVNKALAQKGLTGIVLASKINVEESEVIIKKQIEALNAAEKRIEKLGKQAGGSHTVAKTLASVDGGGDEAEIVSRDDEFMSYPHNEEAMKQLDKI